MRRVASAIALGVAVLLLWIAWPTPYRYDHWRYDGDDYPVRTNRFTGAVQIMTRAGWRPLRPSPPRPVFAPAVPAVMDTGYRLDTTHR